MCKIHDQRFSLPTFSAGLSEYFPGEDVEQLIHRADTIMYQAKNSGRNAIKIASHDETLAESNHS
jgi:PleD family two-component response regulator